MYMYIFRLSLGVFIPHSIFNNSECPDKNCPVPFKPFTKMYPPLSIFLLHNHVAWHFQPIHKAHYLPTWIIYIRIKSEIRGITFRWTSPQIEVKHFRIPKNLSKNLLYWNYYYMWVYVMSIRVIKVAICFNVTVIAVATADTITTETNFSKIIT